MDEEEEEEEEEPPMINDCRLGLIGTASPVGDGTRIFVRFLSREGGPEGEGGRNLDGEP